VVGGNDGGLSILFLIPFYSHHEAKERKDEAHYGRGEGEGRGSEGDDEEDENEEEEAGDEDGEAAGEVEEEAQVMGEGGAREDVAKGEERRKGR